MLLSPNGLNAAPCCPRPASWRRYGFEENTGVTVADLSGNNNTGTITGRNLEHQRQIRKRWLETSMEPATW